MGRSPDYARYLRLAVEHQQEAEEAESRHEDYALVASHLQRAAYYRSLAEQAAQIHAAEAETKPGGPIN